MEQLKVIAQIHTEFPEKFGIPRQSGLVNELQGRIILEKEYRNKDVYKGLEEYSHIWLLWGFSANADKGYSPTVTPPRLGGKEKKGVFATRSPFRPNPIGLSCVQLKEIIWESKDGPVLVVQGADLMDGTPIYDIKPYLPYTDAHPDALGSFGQAHKNDTITVIFPEELQNRLPLSLREGAYKVLEQDPRAAYNKKEGYVYGMSFGEYDIRFTITGQVLQVCDVVKREATWERIK